MGNMIKQKKMDLRDTIFSDKPHSITISGWWYTYPSEKWWSLSVGMITFPTYGKIKNVPSHQPDILSSTIHTWQSKIMHLLRYFSTGHLHWGWGYVPRFSIETILPYDFPMLFHCHIWCTIDHVLNRPPSTDLLIAFPTSQSSQITTKNCH